MANESRNWMAKLHLHHLMRENESHLPLECLKDEEIDLLSKFIARNRDQITLPGAEISELNCLNNYRELAFLLHLLQNNSVIVVIDVQRSFVIWRITKLGWYSFSGSWFDSLKNIMVDNAQNDRSHLVKLEDRELKLKHKNNLVCERLEMEIHRAEQQKPNLIGDHGNMQHHRIKCFERQRKEFDYELSNIMEKKKLISDARKSLNFFYPI
ncbi:hypothetical protein P8452_09856 [Trifolium repens]|nr:hypothetical protein P8452_09856 [Trifolium repens]